MNHSSCPPTEYGLAKHKQPTYPYSGYLPSPVNGAPVHSDPVSYSLENYTPMSHLAKINPLKHLNQLTQPQRLALCQGDRVPMYIGDNLLGQPYLRVLSAVSTKAVGGISRAGIRFPTNIDPQSVVHIFAWLDKALMEWKVPRIMGRRNLLPDLKLLNAAEALGMSGYFEHIFKYYYAYFKNNFPTWEELEIVDGELDVNHGLYECLVKHIAYLIRQSDVPDPESLSVFLADHPKLNAVINETNKFFNDNAARKATHAADDGTRGTPANEHDKSGKAEKQNPHHEWSAARREKEKKDNEYWAQDKAKKKKLGESVREKWKMPKKDRKWTNEEKTYIENTTGRRPA